MNKKLLVTSALPYANGPIHFGHIAGAYLPADIFVRFSRMCSEDVVYICGSDEHGVAITVSAQLAGVAPIEHVNKYHRIIKGIFDKFNIRFDNFSRTTKKQHYELSQKFFLENLKNGYIEKKSSKQLYCGKCSKFLADRYIVGTCPECGFEEARGDECGKCGKWLDALEIKEPRCRVCGSSPEVKETEHWYLQMQKMSGRLEKWLDSKKDWKDSVVNFVKKDLAELRERPITRDMDWGVPVPLEGAEGKVLYVWFDAPIGYISSTVEWAERTGNPDKWKDYWMNPDCRVIHFIGKDNIPFHCIVWPAMIMGQDMEINLPDNVPANEFFHLEGKQFSKSNGWYIELDDFFQKYPADAIRYTLAVNAPETRDSEFTWKGFQRYVNADLANTFGNFINRSIKFTLKNFGDKIPEKKSLTGKDRETIKNIDIKLGEARESYSRFEVRNACFCFMELAREGNRYFDENAPWKLIKEDRERCATVLSVCLDIINALSIMSHPVIPETSAVIQNSLGFTIDAAKGPVWPVDADSIPEIKSLKDCGIIMSRIEDKTVNEEIEKLKKMSEKASAGSKKKSSKKNKEPENISFKKFMDTELRVGTILEASPVEGSEKLLKMVVSLGEFGQRQIVGGLAKDYSASELKGKKVIVVANLEPAMLMRNISEGMLLAAEHHDGLELISVGENVPEGSRIR
ncbi:MAG: methionine--tRNA ligase [Fibrobacterota bacterium]